MPTPEEVALLYARTRDEFVAQLRRLTPEEAATTVPSCPNWTVKDVVAHVVGLVADVLAEVPPPLGTDEMTSRQVAERSAMSLGAICDEWQANAEAIVPFLTEVPLRGLGLTADLAVHVHDVAETLDAVDPPPAEATAAACERYVPLLQERAAEQLELALTVDLNDRRWEPSTGLAPLRMEGTPTDFLRGVTGRRTRDHVADAFLWDGDPMELLDGSFTQYGPYRVG